MSTITQAIRPYLEHHARCSEALARAIVADIDAPYWACVNAVKCSAMHAQLAAKRARDALRATPVQPLCDPSWVGTVNMDAGFDPAQRHRVLASATLLVCRHMDRLRMRDRADERAHATALAFALML